jgi:PAS domain S-box-containing protein
MTQDDSNLTLRDFLDRYAGLIAKTERVTRVGRWVVDLETGEIWWTPETYRIHGLDPATFKPSIASVRRFYTDKTQGSLYQAILHSVQTGEPFDQEVLLNLDNGQQRWIRMSGFAETKPTGGIRAFGLTQDIHDRVVERTQRQLYYELSPDMICIVDPTGAFHQVNPSFLKETGYSESEVIGKFYLDITHPDDRQANIEAFRQSLHGGGIDGFEVRIISKSGQVVWSQWRTRPDPVTGRLYAAGRVITEQKLLKDQLARDAQILANITHMVTVYDSAGAIVYWNSEAHRLLGWSPQEAVGKHFSFRHGPEHVAKTNAARDRILAGEDMDREWLDVHKNGKPVWLRIRARRLVDPAGKPIGIISVGTDITQIKETENRLRLLINELDHRVKNNLASVISIARQTASASDSLKQFQSSFEARIQGLVLSHNTLTEHKWKGVPLDTFMARVIAPFTINRSDQLRLHGPPINLPPELVSPLGMSLNELATNAFKYGALSTAAGTIEIAWELHRGSSIIIRWNESHGPRIESAGTPHMGMNLMRGLLEYQLGGHIDFDFNPDGLKVLITIPLPANRSTSPSTDDDDVEPQSP